MQYRNDRYGNPISALGFGCMRFTRKGGSFDVAKAEKEVLRAVELGVNYFDTAYLYVGNEACLGEILSRNHLREKVHIATKLPQYKIASAEAIEACFQEELRRLQTDYIDIYWIHNSSDVERWTPHLIPLVKSGKVRRVGASNHNLAQIKRAEEILSEENIPLSAVQNHFSLLCRASEEEGVLEYCQSRGIDFFAYMVLEQGALSGKYNAGHPMPADSRRGQVYNPYLLQLELLTDAMKEVAEKYNAGVPQIGIAWAIARGAIPIIGATKPEQIEEIAGAAMVKLTQADCKTLEQAAAKVKIDTRGPWERSML